MVGELRDGIRSAPEAELRDVVNGSTVLPPVRWNPALIAHDGTTLPPRLAAELARTHERATTLALYGVQTLHIAPRDVREEPDRVLAVIERVCRERPRGFIAVTVVRE